MSKDVSAGGIVSPSNLWGKPLPKAVHKTDTKKEKDTGMLPEDVMDEDVDAELEGDEPSDDELEAEEDEVNEELGDDHDADDEDSDADEADDDESEEEVDSTVEPDEKVSTKKKVTTPMAGKKKSMSDHVREEIARRQESGDSLRGVDIMGALSKKGVKVSAAQISQLLKKAGVSKAKAPKKTREAAEEKSRAALSTRKGEAAPKAAGRKPAAVTGALPVEHLKAAKAFVTACGDSYDEALNALELHKQLHDVL